MTRIIIDPSLQSQLEGQTNVLEVCDRSGKLIGHFLPAVVPDDGGALEPQISQEEIESRLRAGGGRPLAAILADLERNY